MNFFFFGILGILRIIGILIWNRLRKKNESRKRKCQNFNKIKEDENKFVNYNVRLVLKLNFMVELPKKLVDVLKNFFLKFSETHP